MKLSPEVLAAHEAGHLVMAKELGVQLLGIEVHGDQTRPGRVWGQGPLNLDLNKLQLLVWSGLAGEQIAFDVHVGIHIMGDRELLNGKPEGDRLSDACMLLRAHRVHFDAIRARLLPEITAGVPLCLTNLWLDGHGST